MNRKERRRLASKKLYSHRAAIRKIFHEMVESGELVPTGEMRPDRNGVLRPVYVLRAFAKSSTDG
jgi:hypothetical protein